MGVSWKRSILDIVCAGTNRYGYSQGKTLPCGMTQEKENTMKKLIDTAKWLYADEEGATMVEYALLLALIAVVSIVIITTLGTKVTKTFTSANTAIP